MSILDLHGDDMLAASQEYIKPKPQEPRFDWGAVASAVPRGATEAVFQVSASVSEAAQAPMRRRDLPGVDGSMTNEFSEVFRAAGRELRPDPQTAHVAEQVLYQFARGATKIIGGALAAGPVGVVAMGLEEANTQADELRREGVDLQTRALAGGVQGAGLALAALPLVGQSLKATAGLYVAGGPGGYVAQQALTREILQGAGYEQIGAQFDPLDPVGLAVSALVPLPFVAMGMRGQRAAVAAREAEALRAGPVPSEMTPTAAAAQEVFAPEVVDAARVLYGIERRAAANPAADDVATAARHDAALTRAEQQLAAGEPVQVADAIQQPVIQQVSTLADALNQVRRAANPEPVSIATESAPPANLKAATPARSPGTSATEPSLPKPGAQPDPAQTDVVIARLAQFQADFPDLRVRMDGDETPRPLSQFLADVQREADEMAADAPLVQELAACSLLNGFN